MAQALVGTVTLVRLNPPQAAHRPMERQRDRERCLLMRKRDREILVTERERYFLEKERSICY
jgi:hypothetical protein